MTKTDLRFSQNFDLSAEKPYEGMRNIQRLLKRYTQKLQLTSAIWSSGKHVRIQISSYQVRVSLEAILKVKFLTFFWVGAFWSIVLFEIEYLGEPIRQLSL